ncbi:MAG: hypothetical protein P8076_07085 [Gammaproteobacteria bacterium]
MTLELLLLACSWAAYLAAHSLLASLGAKRWLAARWPRLVPAYRLAYNTLATVLLAPLLWWTYALPGAALWRWEGWLGWVADGAAGAAALGFLWSLRYYDGAEFLGLRQWRRHQRDIGDQERLHISPLHRFVRHPWYSLGLVMLWTRDMDPALLLAAIIVTMYLLIGLRLEEQKLLQYHGEAYRRYRAQVPALIPLPWRHLDRDGAAALEREAATRLAR